VREDEDGKERIKKYIYISLWNKVKKKYYFNDIGKCKGNLLWDVLV